MSKKENELIILVTVKEFENKNTKKKFNSYRTCIKDESGEKNFVTVKFGNDVENKPTKSAYIYVSESNVNISEGGNETIMWVNKVNKIVEKKFDKDLSKYFKVNNNSEENKEQNDSGE